jgi:hypothetical protein
MAAFGKRIPMRYFEKLPLEERRRLVLGAVAFSSALEGMMRSRDECLAELKKIDRSPTPGYLTESDGQAEP